MSRLGGVSVILKFGLIAAILLCISLSCANLDSVKREITPVDSTMTLNKKSPYLKAHMKDGRVYILKAWSVDTSDSLVKGTGTLYDFNRDSLSSGNFSVGLDSVAIFETNIPYGSASVLGMAIITGVSLSITAACIADPKACFGSCPTFYVTNGRQPVLQAEGFSSSIAPSLEATDVDALYRAHPARKTVSVEMRNEALETHVVRYVNLLVVPKPENERVFKDNKGNYWRASRIVSPDSCTGPEGNILNKVISFDENERYSLADSTYLGAKETLDLWFDHVPKGKTGLVIASRQTLLSTFLFYQTLSYMGKNSGTWLASLRLKNDFFQNGDLSRILGKIDVMIQDSTGTWKSIGTAGEQGPLATDVFMVPLPSGYQNRPLHLRLRMTKGDWRIDYIALAGLAGKVSPIRIRPYSVLKGHAKDRQALSALTNIKKVMITMPGDRYMLKYRLPEPADHYELFLESHGYYLEWMRKEWSHEENQQKLVELLFSPKMMLHYLAPVYKKTEGRMEEAFWNSRYAHPIK